PLPSPHYAITVLLLAFSLSCYGLLRALHSFPTRRSSDLVNPLDIQTPCRRRLRRAVYRRCGGCRRPRRCRFPPPPCGRSPVRPRSEEHTSELQSRFDLVCRLLLEKKKIGLNPRFSYAAPH